MGYVESSPAVANGVVYVGAVGYILYALDANTGALLWRDFLPSDPDPSTYYFRSSPVVADGRLYVGSCMDYDYTMHAYALDPLLEGRLFSQEADARALPPNSAELIPDCRLAPQKAAQQGEPPMDGETDPADEAEPDS
jgi:outer membrane protein assembly factor BamB